MECANCKRPAKMACGGCKGYPVLDGDAPIAHYCDSACQKADWAQHKKTCHGLRDRMTLYRVADIAQRLFYIYREITWCQLDVERVEKCGNNLFLRGKAEPNGHWPGGYRVFPSYLFTAKEDREAVLSLLACIDAMLWMNEFVEGMLRGIVEKSVHIICKTKNDKRRTRCYPTSTSKEDIDSDTGGITHQILKVTLRTGEEFAVDLAGAQYGCHEPVTGWKDYKEHRILFEYLGSGGPPPKPLGQLKFDDYSLGAMVSLVRKMGEIRPPRVNLMDIHEAMNINLVEWQRDENLSIKAMLKLPEKVFQRKKDDLIDYVDWKLDNPEKKYHTVNGRRLKKMVPGR